MPELLNIAVCEDTQTEAEKLLSFLSGARIPNRCVLYRSAEELLAAYQPLKYDLLLMDIYMGGMTGVEAVSKIREIDEEVSVVFITTSKDFALESYRLSALNYLVKPYEKREIEAVLEKAQAAKENVPSLVVRWDGREKRIPLSRIVCLEIRDHQLLIYLTDGSSVHVYEKLSDVLPRLGDKNFFQCHKSFCVNLAQAEYFDEELCCFKMVNEKNVPVRRALMGKAKKAWEACLIRRTRKPL